jgi:hypothetical protein
VQDLAIFVIEMPQATTFCKQIDPVMWRGFCSNQAVLNKTANRGIRQSPGDTKETAREFRVRTN